MITPMPKKITITLEVMNEAQGRELNAAWAEIVRGEKLERTEALEQGTDAIMERARPALKIIETAIREHPTSGQAGRLVRSSRRSTTAMACEACRDIVSARGESP